MQHKLKSFMLFTIFLLSGYSCVLSQVTPMPSPGFEKIVNEKLKGFNTTKREGDKFVTRRMSLDDVCPIHTNKVAERIFTDYGAIYVAKDVIPPTSCVFTAEYQVQAYQSAVKPVTDTIGGVVITLQEPAMKALKEAQAEALKVNLRISPRGGSLAARRSYEDTRSLWNSRFLPGLNYWAGRGKLTKAQADEARMMPTEQQVEKVLEWESGQPPLYFSKDFSKSILYSVAAPGASQHISMLALDVQQFADKRVRAILARHGWFQTVKSDLPHFTYLGLTETELPTVGLKSVKESGQDFWIPDLR
jgi:hypothetical protein